MLKKIIISKIRYDREMMFDFDDLKKGMDFYCGTVVAYMDRTKEKIKSVKILQNLYAYEVTIVSN